MDQRVGVHDLDGSRDLGQSRTLSAIPTARGHGFRRREDEGRTKALARRQQTVADRLGERVAPPGAGTRAPLLERGIHASPCVPEVGFEGVISRRSPRP